MKEHFCPAEQSTITYQGECSWCGEKETLAQTQEPVAWLEPEWGEKICPEVGYEVTMTDEHPRDLCWTPLYAHPPQRAERPVDCERCNRLEEHAYDLIAKLRVANIKLSMQSQRTWVGLTAEQMLECNMDGDWTTDRETAKLNVQAKLKELNT